MRVRGVGMSEGCGDESEGCGDESVRGVRVRV